MGKSKNGGSKAGVPKKGAATVTKSGGLDEIDSLFAKKKQSDKEIAQQISEEKERSRQERKRRKQARLEEEADEWALRGSAGAASAESAGGKKGDAAAPAALHERAKKLSSLTYTRADLEQLNDSNSKEAKSKWATDGLGGVFNGEGYTGRRDDGGHRVFKAHLMNKEGFGESPECPFDCNCCFI